LEGHILTRQEEEGKGSIHLANVCGRASRILLLVMSERELGNGHVVIGNGRQFERLHTTLNDGETCSWKLDFGSTDSHLVSSEMIPTKSPSVGWEWKRNQWKVGRMTCLRLLLGGWRRPAGENGVGERQPIAFHFQLILRIN